MRIALAACFLLACTAHDVRVHYPLASPDDAGGTLVLLLTQPADDVTVAIDGVLVAANAHTQRLVIDRVPVGTAEVIVAANGEDKSFKAWIGTDHATTVPLGVPDASMGFIKTLAGTLITIVVYSLLHP
ncbi:MAG TPA: hypothetical protein VH143_19195 [Kofleriaceae bacterium]|jgi:hypothetical protein|nr:hypothetical protein [Kofleriaceae bacterium]